MVVYQLGESLLKVVNKLNSSHYIPTKLQEECIKELCTALLSADVSVSLVQKVRNDLRARLSKTGTSATKLRKDLQKEIYKALLGIMSTTTKPFTPVKGSPQTVLLVGLQGAGKTTTASKLANYYKQRGFAVGMVGADTYRAGAFAQLQQNCAGLKVPFFGSPTETDAALLAKDGVEHFRRRNTDLVFVDTSGRHKNEKELLAEIQAVEAAVSPDHAIFVIDGLIGQSAVEQARYFREAVALGSAVVTKMDGNAKGGGALSAVASAGVPVAFLGGGERMGDLERFSGPNFVKRLLGMGDLAFLVEELETNRASQDAEAAMEAAVKHGKMTFRVLRLQLAFMKDLGSVSYLLEMIPGFAQAVGGRNKQTDLFVEGNVKKLLVVIDSMRKEELDSDGSLWKDAVKVRLARGSGQGLAKVDELFRILKPFRMMMRNGLLRKMLANKNAALDSSEDFQTMLAKLGSGKTKKVFRK